MTRAERRRLEKAGARKEPVYTLTQTQINEIRRQAVLERKEELKASISREIDERIQKEWAAREEALTGETDEEQILKVLCLLLAVPAKVLCEKFRWKPIEDENDRRSRFLQFSEAVVKEVNRTFENDNVDIRAIGEEVYEKYGVRFEVR